jgi:hypothetical protein
MARRGNPLIIAGNIFETQKAANFLNSPFHG